MRRALRSTAVLAGYAAVSFAYFGWRLLPNPGRELVGMGGLRDPEIFVWSLGWWPHAILHGSNPFYSHAIYAPTGVNLTWVTSVPALAVAFSPVTLLFGPSVAYNVAAVLLPALTAWTAYLLCRYVTRSTWAGLVGGYLYGFSSFVLGHQLGGHLNLTATFPIPLAVLAVLRYVRRDIGGGGLLWRLAAILAFEAYTSTELTLTLALMAAIAFVAAFALVPAARPRLASALPWVAGSYAIAAALAAPLAYYALTGLLPNTIAYPWTSSADLLNLVVPTRIIGFGGSWLHSVSERFPSNDTERPLYFGLPALAIVVLYLRRRPWTPGTRFLVAALAAALFVCFGTAFHVGGYRLFPLPWSVPSHWKAFNDIAPDRFVVYAGLAVAVLVASWIASTRGRFFRRPVVLPLLAAAALVPTVWDEYDVQHPQRLSFFADGSYKNCIPPGETLLIFPFARWGDSMLWQAESGFWFDIAEGSLMANILPESFAGDDTVNKLLFSFLPPNPRPSPEELLALARRRGVGRVVSAAYLGDAYPTAPQMQVFGPVQTVEDVYVAPACSAPPLAG